MAKSVSNITDLSSKSLAKSRCIAKKFNPKKAFAHKQGLRYHLKKDHKGKKSKLTLPGGVLNMTGAVGAWAGQEVPPPPESKFKWIPKGGGFWQCPMCDFKTKNKWYKSGKIRKTYRRKTYTKILRCAVLF